MADGAIQFYGDIDFRTGAASSVNNANSFSNRNDIGGAKTILITNGDTALKRIVCVEPTAMAVAYSLITGFGNERNKTFTHVTSSKPPPNQTDSVTIAGFTGGNTSLNGVYEGNVVDGYFHKTTSGAAIEINQTFNAGAPNVTNYQWGIVPPDSSSAIVSTNAIDRDETEGANGILPPYAAEFTMAGGVTVTATSPYTTGQVKWELFLPRFQSIVLQKESTDKIYIQKVVLGSNGSLTHSAGINTVITPINRMYKDTHKVRPLPGHSTTAAGVALRTDLNKATCFIASTSSATDGTAGRCIVIADAAGNTIAKTMIPGFSYMKMFKRPTDTVYCEEALFSDTNAEAAATAFVNVRFSPIGITN